MLTALYNAIDKQSCTLNVTFKHNRNYINYTHSIKISYWHIKIHYIRGLFPPLYISAQRFIIVMGTVVRAPA